MNQSQTRRSTISALIAAAPRASTSGIRASIRRHPVTAYLIMAFTGLWLSLIPVLFLNAAWPYLFPFSVIGNILVFALPAFLVTAIADGEAGVRDLLGRSLSWKAGVRWYALALLGIPAGILLIATIYLGAAPLESLGDKWTLLIMVFVSDVLMALVTVQLFEELGWTGFVQHRLQDRHGALRASLIVALGFALIHFPTFFIGAPITGEAFLQVLLMMVPITVFAVFLRALITWLYNGSGRSILIAALLHAVFNTVDDAKLTGQLVPESAVMWIPLAAVALLAVLVTLLSRGQLAYEPEPGATREGSAPDGTEGARRGVLQEDS